MRMSPPAQKPRSPEWSSSTNSTAGSSRQASSAAVIARHMPVLSACSAWGRFSVMRPTLPSMRVRTSSVMVAGLVQGSSIRRYHTRLRLPSQTRPERLKTCARPADRSQRGIMTRAPLAAYPALRLRRLRQADWIRRLVRESVLTPADLIWSMVVHEGEGEVPVASMPGVSRLSVKEAAKAAVEAKKLGIPAIAIFPHIDGAKKDASGLMAHDPNGVIAND